MSELTLEKLLEKRKRRAQGLVEFALILPVLLFMIMAIIDFGRALFTYAQASSQLRSALRLASVVGSGSPTYLDCVKMRDTAQGVFFAEPTQVVVISYYQAANFINPTPLPPAPSYSGVMPAGGNCLVNTDMTPYVGSLKNGDVLRISVTTKVRMITPFFPPMLTFTLNGQRTIVTSITLVNADYSATLTDDELTAVGTTYYEQTQDALAFIDMTANADVYNTATVGAAETLYASSTPAMTITPNGPTVDPNMTPTITNTPQITQVLNLKKWSTSQGSKCSGANNSRYVGLQWSKLIGQGVQGYFIYANGIKVGKTRTSNNSIQKCGRSVSKNVNNGISGCFNVFPGAWSPNTAIDYTVAGFKDNGATVGPQSNVLTLTC